MTRTMTAEPTTDAAEENLVDAAARAAEELKAKSLATIRPEQQTWDDNQLAILRQIGVEDATQADVDLFFHYCRTTGLDPFRKQIYMIGRNTKLTEWVDQPSGGRTKVEKWVTKYTIQTGIDGYRRNGREAAKQLGDSLSFEGPFYTGDDDFTVLPDGKVVQHWREVWPKGSPPHASKFVVFRNGEPFTAIAHFDEFVQTAPIYEGSGRDREKVGDGPNSMWAKMPRNQIAKCAEALAWRRAYPDDFAGLILEDAAQPTVIDQDGNVEQPAKQPPRRARGTGGLRDAAAAARQADEPPVVVDGEVAERTSGEAGPDGNWTPEARRKGLNRMHQLFGKGDLPKDARDDRLLVTSAIVGRNIASSNDLADDEIARTNHQLDVWDRDGQLVSEITEILNRATLAQMEAEQAAAEAASDTHADNAEADLARREAEAETAHPERN